MIDVAERLLEVLEAEAPRARTSADRDGDPSALESIVESGLRAVPAARALADPAARRDLRALDPRIAETVERWFSAPLRREARMRAGIARARVRVGAEEMTIAAAMRLYRTNDEAKRRAARAVIDPALESLAADAGLASLASVAEPASPAAPVVAKPPPVRVGMLVLPSADLIQSLAGGGTLDPGLLAEMSVAAGEPEARSHTEEGLEAVPSALRELARALAESILGRAPATFGEWRAAISASHVADFRPAPELALLGRAAHLPFEQPAVPLARHGAFSDPSAIDAAAVNAHLLGAVTSSGDRALGAALALTAPARAFVRRSLRELPGDLARASRAFALVAAWRSLAADLAARANGDAERLRDLYQDTFGAAPSHAIAAWWAAESGLSRAPGEEDSLYAHTRALDRLLLRGVTLAAELRERFDEDWFRNPSLTSELLDRLARAAQPAGAGALVAWLAEAAQ